MDKKEERERFRITDLPFELTERGREIWLAGLGAFSAVEEEGSKVFTNLVERGTQVEEEGKSQLEETYKGLSAQQQEAMKKARETASGLELTFYQALARAMESLGVPTRNEVNRLSNKVDQLSTKVDALMMALEKRETTAEASPGHTISTYHVQVQDDDEWAIKKEGAARALKAYETKKEALEKGRALAERHEPSRLVVHRHDGSVQETFAYGDEA